MAAVIGAVKGAVKDAMGAVADQVQLPQGEWIDSGKLRVLFFTFKEWSEVIIMSTSS